jgi:hypothetical protein
MDISLLQAAKNALRTCIDALEDNAYDLAATEIKMAKQTLQLLEENQPMSLEAYALKPGEKAPEHLLNPDGLCWIGQGAHGPQRATWSFDRPCWPAVRFVSEQLSPHFNKHHLLHYNALPLIHYAPGKDTDGRLLHYQPLP